MTNERHIKIFGLGLALLLAAGVLLHLWQLHLGVIPTLLIFGLMLFVIEKSLVWPWVYGVAYGVIALKAATMLIQTGGSQAVMVCSLLSVIFLLIVLFKPSLLNPLYGVWMKAAHVLGSIVTTLIFAAVYFCVFTPVSLWLKLFRKDHLQRKIDRSANSYWQARPASIFSKEKYLTQG